MCIYIYIYTAVTAVEERLLLSVIYIILYDAGLVCIIYHMVERTAEKRAGEKIKSTTVP